MAFVITQAMSSLGMDKETLMASIETGMSVAEGGTNTRDDE